MKAQNTLPTGGGCEPSWLINLQAADLQVPLCMVARTLDENLQHKLGMRFLDVGTCRALALPWPCDVALREDGLTLLRSLPDGCAAVVFSDPQYRDVLDKLAYGNEGARQRERCALPAMTIGYIDACCREIARVLRPSGYLMLWSDTFRLCEGAHHRVADVIKCVDLIAWDSLRPGNGYRSRRRGDYLLVLQKPPLAAKSTWRDHGIANRWLEKVDRSIHAHIKPIGLITRLIGAVTQPGDLVVDPAAGSFVVMHAAHQLGRNFIGCDLMDA